MYCEHLLTNNAVRVVGVDTVLVMGKSIRMDSNRFTLLNRNEEFRFSTTATTL